MSVRILSQLTPIAAALVVSLGRLRLVVDRWSLGLLAIALVLLSLARSTPGHGLLVASSFMCGTIGLVRVVRATSGSRLLGSLAGAGGLANIVPIAVYGAMPVSAAARERLSPVAIAEPSMFDVKHTEVVASAGVARLGDVVPIPAIGAVVSVGDVVLLVTFVIVGVHSYWRVSPRRSTSSGSATGHRRRGRAAIEPGQPPATSPLPMPCSTHP
jgi:hypothetical protein